VLSAEWKKLGSKMNEAEENWQNSGLLVFSKMRVANLSRLAVLLALSLSGVAQQSDTVRDLDTARSKLTLRVYKTGLFSAFAHDHEIHAPIQSGSIDERQRSVHFMVDSRSLQVVDPTASESERSTIQSTMLGPKVLDSGEYPEIRFRSTSVESGEEGKWTVRGDLTLHGETHPVKADVVGQNGHYTGSAQLLQKDFGITPVSIAGGSVKVKNQVRVEFEIFAR
jgi:polyisoprenoid-binding protein YceI